MKKRSERVLSALALVGATFKRAKKHIVYELPNGQKVTMAATPSDHRADRNMVRDIYKAAGVRPEPKPKATTPRQEKPGRQGAPKVWGLPQERSAIATALGTIGLVEQQLRVKVGQLEGELERLRQWWIVRLIERWSHRHEV
jgi:hypothetical protein